MTTIASRLSAAPAAAPARLLVSDLRFDWISVALSAWLVGGAYLDGWAHNHIGSRLESFFTPWHAVLYSGFLVCAIFLFGTHARNLARGYHWRHAVPSGYEQSLLGVIVFALGGVGDLLWHTLFGIEASVEVLLSPTHHLLVIGIALVVSGAWRAVWHRRDDVGGWRALLPMILSALLFWSIITFIMQGWSPFVYPGAGQQFVPRSNLERDTFQLMGTAQIVLMSALQMGIVLLMLWRWRRLPVGTFTLMFTLNALLMVTQHYEFRLMPALILGGVAADLLLALWRPLRVWHIRAFAFVVPVVIYALYFVLLARTDTIWWKMHSIGGSIFAAGITGLLLTHLVFQPSLPTDSR